MRSLFFCLFNLVENKDDSIFFSCVKKRVVVESVKAISFVLSALLIGCVFIISW